MQRDNIFEYFIDNGSELVKKDPLYHHRDQNPKDISELSPDAWHMISPGPYKCSELTRGSMLEQTLQ